jgi:hypothetical protein
VREALITLRVLRDGKRTDELLGHLARRLGRDELQADEHGAVQLCIKGRPGKAWDLVRQALDEGGTDWREWIYLSPRPAR